MHSFPLKLLIKISLIKKIEEFYLFLSILKNFNKKITQDYISSQVCQVAPVSSTLFPWNIHSFLILPNFSRDVGANF